MVLKRTITDEEMLEITSDIINELIKADCNKSDALILVMFSAAVAAEIFKDGEEVSSTKVADQYTIGDYRYNVITGGDVGDEYCLVIEKNNDMLSSITVPTEAEALKYIIKHHAKHHRVAV